MPTYFVPNKFKRVEESRDRKDRLRKSSTHNQPRVKIWTVTLFSPKPRDRLAYYIVNPDKPLDLQKVAERMAELYGMNVYVYENLFNLFDVNLEKATEFSVIERVTLQVLSEFDA